MAQYIFQKDRLPETLSILKYAEIADAGNKALNLGQVHSATAGLAYRPLSGKFGNLGFTSHTYWIRFGIENSLDVPLTYYLETAEPVTNNVNLYLLDREQLPQIQRSGDNLDFKDRAFMHRKTVFVLHLKPQQKSVIYIEVKNDGEKNTLPLILHSQENLLSVTYHEQLLFGFFYGILFAIAITYLFFFFALKEITFLYYSLYVIFTGLCHAALDGYLHQYILKDNGWLNLNAVLISALAGSYFFGRYSEIVLEIKQRNVLIHTIFKFLYALLGACLFVIIVFPGLLSYVYPAVNLLTLSGMLLIVFAIANMLKKGIAVDRFYVSGISILFICFTIVILLNFGYSYNSIFLDNISKIGIAIELIALSLSMANRIRELKSKKEELQYVALQRSREMNELKSHFLSNMSHELRTPLNAIIGLTQVMENEIADPKLKANFELIKQASSNLVSSVNDILDFSQIERGDLKLEYVIFSPALIFENLRQRFAVQAKDKGLTFHFHSSLEPNVFVVGDPIRLDQMLNNILNNAIKFTQSGSINFSVGTEMSDADELKLVLQVADTGEGIPPGKLEKVFQMFSQVEVDNKRRFGGFGIGLCVVKALVDLHQGEIRLTSRLKQGTVCTIDLLYVQSKTGPKGRNAFPLDSYDLMDSRVLVVEDNPMNQMVIRMMLSKWKNTSLSFANDGLAGLEAMRDAHFDIVLMDLQMPVMDGYEAIAAIRDGLAGEQYHNIPIIALTADLMQESRNRVFELGANDYMTKPVDQQLLYDRITCHLS